jgi:hypothetical protein
MSSSYTDFKLR